MAQRFQNGVGRILVIEVKNENHMQLCTVTVYAFKGVLDGFDSTFDFPIAHAELVTLNLATGQTRKLTDLDPSLGIILGAVPVRR